MRRSVPDSLQPKPEPLSLSNLTVSAPVPSRQLRATSSLEEGLRRKAAIRQSRSQSTAAQTTYKPPHHGMLQNAFTPPASPGMNAIVSQQQYLPPNPPISPKHLDLTPTPSHSPTRARASVGSNGSSSSFALEETPGSPGRPDEGQKPTQSASPTVVARLPRSTRPRPQHEAEDGLLGFADFLRDSSFISEHRKSRPASPRIPDCTIREDSTFHKMGGFCKGAKKFRKDGQRGSIKISAGSDHDDGAGDMMRASDALAIPFHHGRSRAATCADCRYDYDLDDMQLDKRNNRTLSPHSPGTSCRLTPSPAEAVRTSESGARYRLRLLYKSHLRQGNSAETHYACLWCMRARLTVREADATVFRSAEDLLRHLARHPQPLPAVTGVSVRYGQLPDTDSLDFDLHLPESPTPVPMPENVARLATAIAVKDHYRRTGRAKLEKPPKYEADMLEFMEGALITGIIFPEKWLGKWCLGRHDGEFGAFPAKAIELRPPQESEIPVGGENGLSVTARWKWQPPATPGAPWLSFNKGEVLLDVQCEYRIYPATVSQAAS